MSGVCKSQVSRLCGELDERVNAFLGRQIEDDWPDLWVDATYVKMREAGRIVSVAGIVVVGVNTDEQRAIAARGQPPPGAPNGSPLRPPPNPAP